MRTYTVAAARRDLAIRHRGYVDAVRTYLRLTDDLEAVIQAANVRTPQNVRAWAPLMSAIFDAEFVRGKFVQALVRAKGATEAGHQADFDYHREHWLFQGGAFIGRTTIMIAKAVRLLLRPISPDWESFEKEILGSYRTRVHDEWSKVRDPLAHELGGGVDALTTYWLPILAMDAEAMDVEGVVSQIVSSSSEAKETRDLRLLLAAMEGPTLSVISESERITERVLAELERHPQR